jgi:hypothetical protein
VTFTAHVADADGLSAEVAVIVADPAAIAVTIPLGLTLAILAAFVLQVTSVLDAVAGVTVAVIVPVAPPTTKFRGLLEVS